MSCDHVRLYAILLEPMKRIDRDREHRELIGHFATSDHAPNGFSDLARDLATRRTLSRKHHSQTQRQKLPVP